MSLPYPNSLIESQLAPDSVVTGTAVLYGGGHAGNGVYFYPLSAPPAAPTYGLHWAVVNVDEVSLPTATPGGGRIPATVVASDDAPNGWTLTSSYSAQAAPDANGAITVSYTLTPPPGVHCANYGLGLYATRPGPGGTGSQIFAEYIGGGF